jgi:acetyl-CoA carboxylase biotin carboxylase subunit
MVPGPIRSILIANRGEIALRVIRACRERGIRSIAVYSDADRTAAHVLASDEAYRLGPAPSRESYLVMDKILEVAAGAGADAIHPGYGFLAENAIFADRVQKAGIRFIGPRAESISAMGNKASARALVTKAGVPTIPGTPGPARDVEELQAFARDAGYPILLKATAGGGGKGIRIVAGPAELAGAFRAAQAEALAAFGDGSVYAEKYLEGPKHIEFQILADSRGNTIHLGERECSMQRRHQKVIEETPSILLDEAMRRQMGDAAVAAARACGYENAGTIEFLVDAHRNFYFLEMNTRLQVEHPITELVTGVDLVGLQIHVADGYELPLVQADVRPRGHAIECRICAEDQSFMPATGRISYLRSPAGPGIREDRGFEEGSEVPVYYDSLLSKLVAWGADREQARARMIRALREYRILGVTTNIPTLLAILEFPGFISGRYTTDTLEKEIAPLHVTLPDDAMTRTLAAVATIAASSGHAGQNHASPDNDPSPPSAWKDSRKLLMRSV